MRADGAPAGYVRVTAGGRVAVALDTHAEDARRMLANGSLYDAAARDPAARALQGRGVAYAVALPASGVHAVVRHNRHGGMLAPLTRDLAQFTDDSIELLPLTDLAAKCARDVVLPTGDVVVLDEFQTGRENYKDFFYAMVGLAGEGANFDGNGPYVRFQTGGGSQQVSLGQSNFGTGPQFGTLPTPPLGNRPAYPGRKPPFNTSQPCHTQQLPDLNGPAAALAAPLQNPSAPATPALTQLRSKLQPFATDEEGTR